MALNSGRKKSLDKDQLGSCYLLGSYVRWEKRVSECGFAGDVRIILKWILSRRVRRR